MSVLHQSKTYVPKYPQFVEITKKHEEAHWHEGEAKLQQDVEQWKTGAITDTEKYFISSILRLFTHSDFLVALDYYDNLIPVVRNNEARNMLGSFASREGIHQRAYALLNDTLGFSDTFYEEFLQYKEMAAKADFITDVSNKTEEDLALGIATQVLVEGVCLFASFAMLLNFSRHGKMLGMTDINLWSIRDESIHVEGLSTLFRTLVQENPTIVTNPFKKKIYQAARDVVALEDAFIDIAFKVGGIDGITSTEVKQYIRAVTDYRMQQLGLKPQFHEKNPFEWLDWLTSSSTVENFFETNTVSYSKNSMVGTYAAGY
jgi:ribonucleoside-diphosphate reductase beta chain